MASSRSEENVVLNYFNTRWCIGVCIPLDLIGIYMNLIYFMADVKPFVVVFVSYFDRCCESDCGRLQPFCW